MASMEPRQNTSDHTFGDVFSTIPIASQQQNNGMNVNSPSMKPADNSSMGHPDDQVMNRIMQMYSSPSTNSSSFPPYENQYQQTQQHSSPQVVTPQPPQVVNHVVNQPNEQIVHHQNSVSAPSTPVLNSTPSHVSHAVQGSAPSLPTQSHVEPNGSLHEKIAGMIEQSNNHRNQQHQQILQHFNTQATQPISSLTNQNREMMTQMQMYFERITRFMEGVERRLNNLENVTSEILKSQSRENSNVPIEKSFADKREFDAVRRAAEQYEKDAELAKKLQQQFEVDSRTPQPPPVQQRPLSISTPTMTARPTPPPSAIKSPHSNEQMEICPICSTQVVVSLLQDHVNECLDGGLGANATKNSADPAQQGSLWKRMFGKKDDASNSATPTPKPADPLPLPPISQPHTVTTTSLYPGNASSHSPPVVRPPPSLYGQPSYPGYPTFNGYPQQPAAAPAYPQNQGYYYYAVPPGK